MSANKFIVETSAGMIQVEAKINAVRVYTIQFDSENGFAEIMLEPDEARELARMINLIATVAEAEANQ